jgi:hypothetical protein
MICSSGLSVAWSGALAEDMCVANVMALLRIVNGCPWRAAEVAPAPFGKGGLRFQLEFSRRTLGTDLTSLKVSAVFHVGARRLARCGASVRCQ